jgi:hypothetical protein
MFVARLVCMLAALLIGHEALATVTDQDVQRFLASKPQTYEPKDHRDEVVDILKAHLPARGFGAAVERLAGRISRSGFTGADARYEVFARRIDRWNQHCTRRD